MGILSVQQSRRNGVRSAAAGYVRPIARRDGLRKDEHTSFMRLEAKEVVGQRKITQRTNRNSPMHDIGGPRLTRRLCSSPIRRAGMRRASRRDGPPDVLAFHRFARGPPIDASTESSDPAKTAHSQQLYDTPHGGNVPPYKDGGTQYEVRETQKLYCLDVYYRSGNSIAYGKRQVGASPGHMVRPSLPGYSTYHPGSRRRLLY